MAAEHTVGAAKWNSEEDKRRWEGKDEERRGAVIGARRREEDRLAAPGWGGRWLPTSPLGDILHVSSGKKTQMLSLSTASAYSSPGEGHGARRLSPPRPADLEARWDKSAVNTYYCLNGAIVLVVLSPADAPGCDRCVKKPQWKAGGEEGKKRERNATQEGRAAGSYCAADCINWIAERI